MLATGLLAFVSVALAGSEVSDRIDFLDDSPSGFPDDAPVLERQRRGGRGGRGSRGSRPSPRPAPRPAPAPAPRPVSVPSSSGNGKVIAAGLGGAAIGAVGGAAVANSVNNRNNGWNNGHGGWNNCNGIGCNNGNRVNNRCEMWMLQQSNAMNPEIFNKNDLALVHFNCRGCVNRCYNIHDSSFGDVSTNTNTFSDSSDDIDVANCVQRCAYGYGGVGATYHGMSTRVKAAIVVCVLLFCVCPCVCMCVFFFCIKDPAPTHVNHHDATKRPDYHVANNEI